LSNNLHSIVYEESTVDLIALDNSSKSYPSTLLSVTVPGLKVEKKVEGWESIQ